MYITIAGELGSGKSTVAKIINQKYGFMLYSTGTLQREIAKEKGITTLELNLQMADNISNIYDKLIDSKTVEISRTNMDKDVIFDSRMAWHFVEQSFKVYVIVDRYTAANRVIRADRGKEEYYGSMEEAVAGLCKRKQVEDSRFGEMYQVATTDFENYDLVVDSTDIQPEQLAEFIMEKARNHSDVKNTYISPKRLLPTQDVSNFNPARIQLLRREEMTSNIDVVLCQGYYYIVEGHHRVCASIQNNDGLIGVNILKADANNIVERYDTPLRELVSIDKMNYCAWESYNSMNYTSYPEQ